MMAMLTREEVHARLQAIFPDGAPNRVYLTRMLAASTVFVALYIGAIEGSGTYLGPKHVYRMTDEQAGLVDDATRGLYAVDVLRPRSRIEGRRWYEDLSREPIRDETLREGLVAIGAVIERTDLATTSSKPRYVLKAGFAALFDPLLEGEALQNRIAAWQAEALNRGALARLAIVRRGAGVSADQVLVTFPNGETRRMKPGPSSEITKAVIEVFATTFLTEPAVVFLSESGNKVVARDDELARSIGLAIQVDKNLPDTILVDLGPVHPLLVFVEVVATDGPISQRRKEALEVLVAKAGFPAEHVAFVTAYLDRSAGSFKKTVDSLAWGSYAWFAAEPERLIEFSDARRQLKPEISQEHKKPIGMDASDISVVLKTLTSFADRLRLNGHNINEDIVFKVVSTIDKAIVETSEERSVKGGGGGGGGGPGMMGMMYVRHERRLVKSLRWQNIKIDASATAMGAVSVASGVTGLTAAVGNPIVISASFLTIAAGLAFTVWRLFEKAVSWEDACVLHAFNKAANYHRYVSEDNLDELREQLVSYYGYKKGGNSSEMENIIDRLVAWRALEKARGGYKVVESVKFWHGPWLSNKP